MTDRIITVPANSMTGTEFMHSLGFGMTPMERTASDERGRKLAAEIKAREAEDREYTRQRVAEIMASRSQLTECQPDPFPNQMRSKAA